MSYRFQYSAKDDNSEFSLSSMVPYPKVKVKLLFWGTGQKLTSENSELSLPSNSTCHRKIPTHCFCPVRKSYNSDFTCIS